MVCHGVVIDLVAAAAVAVVVVIDLVDVVVVVGSCGVIIDARVLWHEIAPFRTSGRCVCCLY